MEIFYLVAEVVIGLALETAGASDKLRDWLGRNPTKLAYERALARAYAAFVRGYPELAERFFDLEFLRGKAAGELAKQLTPQDHLDAARLARLWGEYLYRDRASPERDKFVTNERTVRACADFLRVLDGEIKSEPALRPLVDPKLLDEIQETTARTEGAVQQLFERDLERAQEYRAVVEKFNVAQKFFSGNFVELGDLYIGPEQVFQRVKVDEFVGREWLDAQVDEFLNDGKHSSGYLRIEGEAGVGKTSFLAHLVRERGYLHILNDELRGDNNVKRALMSLGAQIVSRYRMKGYENKDYLPEVAGNTDYLWKLLDKARLELSAGEKIVVVCDALDEAGIGTNGNAFGLPSTLPEQVYFVVTQRPVPVPLRLDEPAVPVRVRPGDPENIEDMREYLRGVAHQSEIASQLRAHHYTHEEFVRVLTDKSGGVWIYLQYVLEEIRRGQHHPLKLEKLPNGLVGYYLNYWDDWRKGRNGRGKGTDEWDAVYMPLLTTLAAAQEPIPLVTLLDWADVTANTNQVRRLLKEDWRAFVTEREGEGGPRFALYHASLRDFLTGDPVRNDLSKLTDADRGFLDELREGTAEAHKRIIGSFRERCRGTWTDLIHDDYARRYLTLHLEGAGEHDTLANLAAWSDAWAKARYGREEDWSGYLTDLDRVWSRAERDETFNPGWQIRCALLESTIHSLSGNSFLEPLAPHVETDLWSPARALAQLSQMPGDHNKAAVLTARGRVLPHAQVSEMLAAAREIGNEDARARALSELAGRLPEGERAEVMSEALAAARGIANEFDRARALSELAGHLPPDLISEALVAAREIAYGYARALALSGLAGQLPEGKRAEVMSEALAAAREIQDKRVRAETLSGLAGWLPEGERAMVMSEALAVAQGIQDEYHRARALSVLAGRLPEEERADVVSEALAAAREIQSEYWRAVALTGLAGQLSEGERAEVMSEALAAAQGIRIKDEDARARALSRLAGQLPEQERAEVMSEALKAARGIQDEDARARVLSELAGQLPKEERAIVMAEALAAAREIEDEDARARVLSEWVVRLPPDLMSEALKAARGIQDEDARARVLSELAGQLPPDVMDEALAAARGIAKKNVRARVLSELAGHLPEGKRVEVVSEALATAREIEDEHWRAEVLTGLARQLPKGERAMVMSEALAAARGIQNEYVRADALSELAEQLPPDVMDEALAVARGIAKKNARARALSELVGQSPEGKRAEVVSEALAAAQGIEDEYARADVLSELARQLPEGERAMVMSEVLTTAREIETEYYRARALSELAGQLPEEERAVVMSEALAAAQGIETEYYRARTLSELAGQLPEGKRAEVMSEAWAAAREIRDNRARAETLSGLAGQLSAEEQLELLPELFDLVTQSIMIDRYTHTTILGIITKNWETLRFQQFVGENWNRALRTLARQPRGELLDDLTVLLPLVKHLGGQAAVKETFYAIRDVTKWWP